MEIINRKHPEIAKTASGKYNCFVSFPNDKDIYFSNAAAIEYKLEAGKYLHFAILDNFLYFYCNNNSNGFRLHSDAKPNSSAVKIINKSAVELLKGKFSAIKTDTRFALKHTESTQDGCTLTEILITKPKKQEPYNFNHK